MKLLSLVSVLLVELQDFVDVMLLDCMLIVLSYPFMSVVCHKSGSLVYQVQAINFLQDFKSFFRTAYHPQWARNPPFSVL